MCIWQDKIQFYGFVARNIPDDQSCDFKGAVQFHGKSRFTINFNFNVLTTICASFYLIIELACHGSFWKGTLSTHTIGSIYLYKTAGE